MKRQPPLLGSKQQGSMLLAHLDALDDVLTALRFSFSTRSFAGAESDVEASEMHFMVDAFSGELGKLYEPADFGSVVEEKLVFAKICHVQGLVYLLSDGIGYLGEDPRPDQSKHLGRAGIGRLLELLASALKSLRELINIKLLK